MIPLFEKSIFKKSIPADPSALEYDIPVNEK
jgi:hypothetical protein